MFPRTLTVSLTEEDYLSFNLFTNDRNLKQSKNIRNCGLLFLVCGVILFVLAFLDSEGYRPIGIGMIVGGSFLTFGHKRFSRSTMKRQFETLKKKGQLPYAPQCTYEFREDSLRRSEEKEVSEISYTAIEEICVIPEKAVYLYRSSLSAYLIPMSAFASVEECHALLRFLQSKKPDLQVNFCTES